MNAQSSQILLIDDEPDIRGLLSITLERMGHQTHCAADVKSAKAAIANHEFQLCLTDLKLPDGSGIDIVKTIQQSQPTMPVIVITAHGSMDTAIQAMKHGAFDFINKPVDLKNLRILINNALALSPQENTPHSIDEIIGESANVIELKKNISKVSRSQAPVFVYGESGSGKELVARAIHKLSSRSKNPFVAVNCGAIPKELMESEFFGHVKGSFTGAHQDKEGLFKAAEGGTLFLDEVADLPMDMQVKLLRAIQEKTIRPVGSAKEYRIDTRIVSATHKNLIEAVAEGLFRNDLYYRINVIEINVPPLRERQKDIDLLAKAILKKIAEKNQQATHKITDDALVALHAYPFPGNIRELENILERASALSEGGIITAEELILPTSQIRPPQIATNTSNPQQTQNHIALDTTTDASIGDYQPEEQSIDEYLDKIEKGIILSTLEKHRWNRTTTAKVLGITFRSLRYRMKKLEIDSD